MSPGDPPQCSKLNQGHGHTPNMPVHLCQHSILFQVQHGPAPGDVGRCELPNDWRAVLSELETSHDCFGMPLFGAVFGWQGDVSFSFFIALSGGQEVKGM